MVFTKSDLKAPEIAWAEMQEQAYDFEFPEPGDVAYIAKRYLPRALAALREAWIVLESLTSMTEARQTDWALLSPESPDYEPDYKPSFTQETLAARALLDAIEENR